MCSKVACITVVYNCVACSTAWQPPQHRSVGVLKVVIARRKYRASYASHTRHVYKSINTILLQDVYHGKQTACTIDGLHFDSVYRARVSAYNKVGRSPCSDVVQLQTSEGRPSVCDVL